MMKMISPIPLKQVSPLTVNKASHHFLELVLQDDYLYQAQACSNKCFSIQGQVHTTAQCLVCISETQPPAMTVWPISMPM